MNWSYYIYEQLPFSPTEGQKAAVDVFERFMNDHMPRVAMVLRGSAGTGKTSVARAIVAALTSLRQKVVLMAPTGRAAKVFSMGLDEITDAQGRHPQAFTIHRRIYRQQVLAADGGRFLLNDNLHTDTLFIIDESSMITTEGGGIFGSGNLLDDLIRYVYSGRNCRMMLIGDTAQLPPVGMEEAPALMSDIVQCYGLSVYEYDLTEVLRQSQESGILYNATIIRQMITHDEMTQLPLIRFKGFADIRIVPGDELIEQLATSYSHAGIDDTIVITRSNKRANIYNLGIRNQVLGREEELCSGDQLMIVKNNYRCLAENNNPTPATGKKASATAVAGLSDDRQTAVPTYLANGDRCVVMRVRNVREFYGFRFADVWLQLPDYDNYELQTIAILDTLRSEAPALTAEQNETLYNNIILDYTDIPHIADRRRRLREDAYFNALQIKYAYAVTCHKAQGGQWSHVYVDQGYMTDDMLTPSYIHWLYTAFTRATETLYLVNWPKTQVEKQ